jgi:hypothetical protein
MPFTILLNIDCSFVFLDYRLKEYGYSGNDFC